MAKVFVSDTPSLAELRAEIDRLDEAMHNLLMKRGEIIDRLIAAKQTQESGSAFRPAREPSPSKDSPDEIDQEDIFVRAPPGDARNR